MDPQNTDLTFVTASYLAVNNKLLNPEPCSKFITLGQRAKILYLLLEMSFFIGSL